MKIFALICVAAALGVGGAACNSNKAHRPDPAPSPGKAPEASSPGAPIPAKGSGSLTCCEATRVEGPEITIAQVVDAASRANLTCMGLRDEDAPKKALHACMAKVGSAHVKACVSPDMSDDIACTLVTHSASVDGRTLIGIGADAQMDDYTWSVSQVGEGGVEALFPQGANYLHPYCLEDEESQQEFEDLDRILAETPAHTKKVPEGVKTWICSGIPEG